MARLHSPNTNGHKAENRGKSAIASLKYEPIPEAYIREHVNGFNHSTRAAEDGGDYRLIKKFFVDRIEVEVSVAYQHDIASYYDDEANTFERVFIEAWNYIPAEAKDLLKTWWFRNDQRTPHSHIHIHLASSHADSERNAPILRVLRSDVNAAETGGLFRVGLGITKYLPPAKARKQLICKLLDWIAYNVHCQIRYSLGWKSLTHRDFTFSEFIDHLVMIKPSHIRDAWLNNQDGKFSRQALKTYIDEMENTARTLKAITTPVPKKPRGKSPKAK